MKSGRIFWGTLLLIVGVLGLLQNLFNFDIAWGGLWRFWPLILILLGVAVFLRDAKYKWIVVAAVAVITGVVVFASVQRGCDGVHNIVLDDDERTPGRTVTQAIAEDFVPGTTRAALSFEAGAGEFRIEDSTDRFLTADIHSNAGSYELTRENEDGVEHLCIGPKNDHVHWHGSMKNTVTLRLNPAPLWDMDFDMGAARVSFDLTPYRVRRVSLDAGASSVSLRLGERADSTDVSINTGAASVHLRVPASAACEIRSDGSALSSRNFEGFTKTGDGVWRAGDFSRARQRITVDIDCGLSSITVERESSPGATAKTGDWNGK
jgi:hypothetical protein